MSSPLVTYAVMRVDGSVEIGAAPLNSDVQLLQDLVGGWIEYVRLSEHTHGYVNEEGKLIPLPVNVRATLLCRSVQAIASSDTINGPLVLLGHDDEGNEANLDQEMIDALQVINERKGGSNQ